MRRKHKLRQVTDNIHGTIYLSQLESELISTPYFYRLHDVYQSSTVYMTFPSNRTKRYEHSLGTMEVASEILFAAVANADFDTKKILFQKLEYYFSIILKKLISTSEYMHTPYLNKSVDDINALFDRIKCNHGEQYESMIWGSIKEAIKNGDFSDSALDHFQYYSMDFDNTSDHDDVKKYFLYRCLIEAIRISALFHDVGHPPYSHIIEEVIKELYQTCGENNGPNETKDKISKFHEAIDKYATKDDDKAFKVKMLYTDMSLVDSEFHERVSLSLLQSAINDVVPQILTETPYDFGVQHLYITKLMYHIMVVEFAIAILVEKNDFFKSFHKIIDGFLDADRLDYIMRDSINSGVDWGHIPYRRLLNSAKLFCYEKEKEQDNNEKFIVAYPQKVSDDINDLMLVRYKIFARINLHHRCMKSAVALQSSVKALAEDYLFNSDDNKCINPDICQLWNSLSTGVGDKQIRIIRWNDSWLISVLHNALINMISMGSVNLALKENLEEILLNRKRYFSLIKRGSDSKKIVEKIFDYADITKGKLEKLLEKEQKKYLEYIDTVCTDDSLLDSPKEDARESILRVKNLIKSYNTGDLEIISLFMPLDKYPLHVTIENKLEELKNNSIIADYSVVENKDRRKIGIPSHKTDFDNLYLYHNSKFEPFNDKILRDQITTIMESVPWLFVYFVPNKSDGINQIEGTLINEIAKEVAKGFKARYEELFGKDN